MSKRIFTITKSLEITQVFNNGTSQTTPYFTLYTLDRPGDRPRFNVIVGKRLGPATTRNHQKRVYRSILRQFLTLHPITQDILVIPKKRSLTSKFQELRLSIEALLSENKVNHN